MRQLRPATATADSLPGARPLLLPGLPRMTASALTSAGSTRRWRRLRAFVLARDGYRCRVPIDGTDRLCGALASHVDHIVRRRDGGSDDPANLRAACRPCNLAREGRQLPRRSPTTGWSW